MPVCMPPRTAAPTAKPPQEAAPPPRGALVIEGPMEAPRAVFREDAETPVPPAGEALVRVSVRAIDAADAALLNSGSVFRGVPGRQMVGVVENVRGRLTGEQSWNGRRVVAPSRLPCRNCEHCRRGMSAHCAAQTVLGYCGREGVLASHVCVPVSSLLLVPDKVPDEHAVFAEDVGCALAAAEGLRFAPGAFVSVLGDCAAAIVLAQLLARAGVAVRVLTQRQGAAVACDRLGLRNRPLHEAGRRMDQDAVFDMTGTAQGLGTALKLIRPRGKVRLSAWPPLATPANVLPGLSESHALIASMEAEVTGIRGCDMPGALALLAAGSVSVGALVGARVGLAESVKALSLAAEQGAVKVLVG